MYSREDNACRDKVTDTQQYLLGISTRSRDPYPLFSAHKKAWDEANWLYVSGLTWPLRSEYIDLRDFFTYSVFVSGNLVGRAHFLLFRCAHNYADFNRFARTRAFKYYTRSPAPYVIQIKRASHEYTRVKKEICLRLARFKVLVLSLLERAG